MFPGPEGAYRGRPRRENRPFATHGETSTLNLDKRWPRRKLLAGAVSRFVLKGFHWQRYIVNNKTDLISSKNLDGRGY